MRTIPRRLVPAGLGGRSVVIIVAVLLMAFSVAGVFASATADAAVVAVSQCDAQGPGPAGATTVMNCDITVVNTINGGERSSVVTVTRQCSLDQCTGSTSSTYPDVVTSVDQCNGSDNDAAHPINCSVTITNRISADTPGAQPVTAATVNQCVGSGSVGCAPFPATTTSATVTQCNGSGNGGGGSVNCTVPASTVSSAIPISVNQCNGTGNPGGSVVTCSASIQTRIITPSTVELTSSLAAVRFGTPVTLTAAVDPADSTGSVTFNDVPATGTTLVLGSVAANSGTASLPVTLPTFGRHVITASYAGDGTHTPATSNSVTVDVIAYRGEVIVKEFRTSGPGGAGDSYVELYNTGPPAPLAGFTVTGSGGTPVTLATTATLATHRSYLLTGSGYSLSAVAGSDQTASDFGAGGLTVTAPDTAATVTDAVGPADGPHLGSALAAMTGTPANEWAWTRLQVAGRPQDTADNAADFVLVSTTNAPVGGLTPALGSASPTGSNGPFQHNATLQSALLDPAAAVSAAPNRSYAAGLAGNPGTLTIRRTVTNSSGAAVSNAKIRITALSEANGPPQPGVAAPPAIAQLRAINPLTTTSPVLTSSGLVTVTNLSVDAPAASNPGGGLNTTLTMPGTLAAGASIQIAITFAVDSHGTYWFGYNVDAR